MRIEICTADFCMSAFASRIDTIMYYVIHNAYFHTISSLHGAQFMNRKNRVYLFKGPRIGELSDDFQVVLRTRHAVVLTVTSMASVVGEGCDCFLTSIFRTSRRERISPACEAVQYRLGVDFCYPKVKRKTKNEHGASIREDAHANAFNCSGRVKVSPTPRPAPIPREPKI